MNLVVAATSLELQPLLKIHKGSDNVSFLVTGAGGIETALNLSSYLSVNSDISRVINIGIAGAYSDCEVGILDLCLASEETLADFGVCKDLGVEPFSFPGHPLTNYNLDEKLTSQFQNLLSDIGAFPIIGKFLSVNSASATKKRGDYLRDTHQAICENMEGFAVARVCASFNLPCVEVRCISNFVEDRDLSRWYIDEACEKLGEVINKILPKLN